MKKILKKGLIRAVKSDLLWKALKPIAAVGIILNNARLSHLRKKNRTPLEFSLIFESLMVQNGPFKGIKYPSFDAFGSAIYPKLLGSYERELHSVFTSFLDNEYSEIIDIGCAEGYYAIGMARRYNDAQIYAYDISERARKLCEEMVILNDVREKVEIRAQCTPELLGSFNFTKKGLIICDCEGFESQLFTRENINNLKKCDLIIELHDFIDLEISQNLKTLFSATHHIKSVFSIDDIHKVQQYDYEELAGLSLSDKKKILGEGRPTIMEWIICQPKTESR